MYQAVRGTVDILPAEQPYWDHVRRIIARLAERYGFARIDTPIFEDTALFRRAGEYTDIVQKEMYTFDDRGGSSLTLKPEGTPAVCRAYLQHGMQNLPQPVRLYYISPIFRYDRPQAGRYRQHHQFGCEAIGEADPAIDAELIDMAMAFFGDLGLQGLSLVINSIGCRQCRAQYLNALKNYYAPQVSALCPDCAARLEHNPLRLLDCKQARCQPAADRAPRSIDYLCPACREHFTALEKYLHLLELPYRLDHRLVRGLDYYTRTVFEVQPPEEGGQSALGGGGRYDNLIEELGGKPTPAAGFAAGIERIILNLKRQGVAVPEAPAPTALICHLGEAAKEAAFRLTASLRRAGVSCVFAAGNRSLKSQMRLADSLKVKYAVILGEEEVKTGTVTLRRLDGGTQTTVTLEKATEILIH